MKKNKPTYITDLTAEIMNNRDLLSTWAEKSVDVEFLELSVDILSDLDLLYSWDCNNILQLKLVGILSGNKDFHLKSGMLINIDESYDFPVKPSLYKKIVKKLIDKKANEDLIKEDLLLEGFTKQEINEKQRFLNMSNYLELVKDTEKYTLNSQEHYLKNLLPEVIERYEESKKDLFKKKSDGFSFYANENGKSKDSKFKIFTKEVWFIVGCKIASGEMFTLLETHKSATKVAKYLGIEKSRPYITDSKYNLKSNGLQSVVRNTNIYSDHNKIKVIYTYCIDNHIKMTDDFIKIYSETNPN